MSEPVHIKEMLPGVMAEIEQRARQSEICRRGVLAALKGFRGGHKPAGIQDSNTFEGDNIMGKSSKAGLITFVKDQCTNFSTSGDCVYGQPCLVVDGKPCSYFERAELGPADYKYRVPGYDYAGLFAAYGQINLSFQGRARKVVGRYCGCGGILRPRERYCPDCRRRNRQKSYRVKRERLTCLKRHS